MALLVTNRQCMKTDMDVQIQGIDAVSGRESS